MTKATIIFFSLSMIFFIGNAQNSMTLAKLIEFANTKSLSSFDAKVRAIGYSFESKEDGDNSTSSIYVKRITTKTMYYNFYLTYVDYGDFKPMIQFSGSSNALPNFLSRIRQQAIAIKLFEDNKDCPQGADNSVAFCFKNVNYSMTLRDIAIREDDKFFNTYRVTIFKR